MRNLDVTEYDGSVAAAERKNESGSYRKRYITSTPAGSIIELQTYQKYNLRGWLRLVSQQAERQTKRERSGTT
jgi:hypothetical protein